MTKRIISNLVLLLLLFAYSLIHSLFIVQEVPEIANFIAASAMIIITSLAIFLLGIRRNKNNLEKKINFTVVIFLIFYFVVSYLIGLETGYLKNSHNLNILSVLDNMVVPATIIICTELFRYIIINSNNDRKFVLTLSTILIIFFELCLNIDLSVFINTSELLKVTTISIIPIISKNIVMSYLTYEIGIKPTLIYRLIMELYIFVVPVIPELGNYLTSIVGVTLPVCIYTKASQIINKYYNKEDINEKKKKTGFIDILVVVLLAIAFMVICRMLPYSALAETSNSIISIFNIGE